MPHTRFRLSRSFFVALVLLVVSAPSLLAATRPEFDAAAQRTQGPVVNVASRIKSDPLLSRLGTVSQADDRFGVPTFFWPAKSAMPNAARGVRLAPEQAARAGLEALAPLYRLDSSDAQDAVVRYVHDTGRGNIVVAFQQVVGGVEVFRDELKVMLDRDHNVIAASGYIPGKGEAGKSGVASFRLENTQALQAALSDLAGGPVVGAAIQAAGQSDGGYARFDVSATTPQLAAERVPSQPARVKRVLYHEPGSLQPAYYIELMSSTEAYSYVVSAEDGSILFRHSLMANDAFTYRVWADNTSLHTPFDGPQGNDPTPHPTGTPNNLNPALLAPGLQTLQNGPISTNDPWLPAGATVTTGNNTDAYADLSSPDGFSFGDIRASTTSPNTFDRTYDTNQAPSVSSDQRMAAVTQLFYTVNYFHDWYYDAGFNEASGNAQTNNFGRGGLQNDAIRSEAQDFSGTNNANMSTPADGAQPRMQMYVFTAEGTGLLVNSPAGIAGSYAVGTSTTFGPQTFDVTADVVLVNDNTGTTSDGCETIVNAIAGKIAFIDRGNCNFTVKVKNAQDQGALGVIMVNNVAGGGVINMGGTDGTITIPTLSISLEDGNLIRAQLGGGVNVRMARGPALNRDGTIDNQIVAHEWGHYISNRLIGNANGLTNNQGRGMGEGWGDFHSMLMTVRAEDASAPANANYSGTYGMGAYALSINTLPDNAYYFGIRRVPYSTDFNRNGFTFRHIENGVPLPVGPPTAFGADGASNAEVHNTGEVWCTMLWECYASLLNDTGRLTFDQARTRMRDYLVAAYKMTPNAPTLTEARDAVLAAASADQADYDLFCAAFARRGIGIGAVSPDRNSNTNSGVVESFSCGGDLAFESAGVVDDVTSCDNDGYLDNNETGTLTVTLRNSGQNALSGTTATVSSTNPNVSFPSGTNMTFPNSAPGASVSATLPIHLGAVVGQQTIVVNISYNDPGLFVPGPRSASATFSGNVDLAPSTIETVEETSPNWTISGGTATLPDRIWRRAEKTTTQHVFFAPDPGTASDQYLVSPPIQVAPTGNFSFQFSHAHQFETDAGGTYDGGVLEISTNSGGSWTDIGASASPGYNGTLFSGSGNPIGGRPAYVSQNAAYPNSTPVTVSLGTTYQGQTVLLRFRATADVSVSAFGWEIDNVQVFNTTNNPFITLQAQTATCGCSNTITASAGSGGSISPSGAVTVSCGSDQTFTITPDACHQIAGVLVDGSPVGAVGTYTFTNVQASHTIAASFSSIGGAVAPITGLAAAQVRNGNDTDGTTKIQVTFTLPGGTTAEVWRKGYGGYPTYDDGGGSVPPTPGAYPPAGWTLTGVTASGQFDEPTSRDYWYYVAYAKNACGVASPVSNQTTGTLGYHLGDVTNGVTAGVGDNKVATLDLSLLGAHYGASGAALTGFAYLDVGPTTDHTISGRPTTDGAANFEDLVMFATNFTPVASIVAKGLPSTTAARDEKAAAVNKLWIEAPEAVHVGDVVEVPIRLSGAGNLQAVSISLEWNASVVEPVEMRPDGWIVAQDGIVLSPEAGTVDAAVLGADRSGITGEGTIATALFRVVSEGDPQLGIARSIGRDHLNRNVSLSTAGSKRGPAAVTSTELFPVVPNPIRGSSLFQYSVAKDGPVELSIYSVDGRRVKTLARGQQAAGSYRVTWSGADDRGASIPSGVYFVRLQAAGVAKTRLITLIQ